MTEVRHILNGMVQLVATRHFVENNQAMLDDLEAYQRACWARAEDRYQQQRAKTLPTPTVRPRPKTSTSSADSVKAGRSDSRPAHDCHGRPRRRSHSHGPGRPSDSAGSVGIHALSTRMAVLHTAPRAQSSAPARGGSASAQHGRRAGGGGPSGSSRRASRLSTPPPLRGSALPASAYSSSGHGRRGKASVAPTSLLGHRDAAAVPDTYAESLFPRAPPRSQFVFEAENPLAIHSNSEADRQLQRRLSMFKSLEAETVKLERSMRSDPTRGRNDFFKLGRQNAGPTSGAGPSAAVARPTRGRGAGT